jgi:hypothetical protein
MATNPASPDISGPRKRKPSTKASTNGDPHEARKRQKSGTILKPSVTTALTKKKNAATVSSKAAAAAPNQASAKGPGKSTQRHATVESDDSEDLDDRTSNQTNPPQNPNRVLEAADGSDDDPDPKSNFILVDDDDDDETNLEAAEVSAEAELGRNFISVSN